MTKFANLSQSANFRHHENTPPLLEYHTCKSNLELSQLIVLTKQSAPKLVDDACYPIKISTEDASLV